MPTAALSEVELVISVRRPGRRAPGDMKPCYQRARGEWRTRTHAVSWVRTVVTEVSATQRRMRNRFVYSSVQRRTCSEPTAGRNPTNGSPEKVAERSESSTHSEG